MTGPGDLLRAVPLALTAPLWTGGPRLGSLVTPAVARDTVAGPAQPEGRPLEGRPQPDDPGAAQAALRLLAILSRVPFGPWRNTCLQRSVIRCRCLRDAGHPAVVRIGVRGGGVTDPVKAHAWVAMACGTAADTTPADDRFVSGYRPLRSAASPD